MDQPNAKRKIRKNKKRRKIMRQIKKRFLLLKTFQKVMMKTQISDLIKIKKKSIFIWNINLFGIVYP